MYKEILLSLCGFDLDQNCTLKIFPKDIIKVIINLVFHDIETEKVKYELKSACGFLILPYKNLKKLPKLFELNKFKFKLKNWINFFYLLFSKLNLFRILKIGLPGTRTQNKSVKSRVLYHWVSNPSLIITWKDINIKYFNNKKVF